MFGIKKSIVFDILIRIIVIIISLLFLRGNIICNDGTISPSCSDCHSGCCSHHGGCSSNLNSKRNNYYNYNNNYNQMNTEEDDNDFTGWAIMLIIGIPVLIAIFGEKVENNDNIDNNKKSKRELFYEKVDDVRSRTDIRKAIIANDSSVKYDKISFEYNEKKIKCIFYAKNEIDTYHTKNSYNIKFKNIGKRITIQNLSKNSSAYSLYKKGIIDYNMSAFFYAADIKIYDYNNYLRKIYDFKSEKLLTKNICKTKKKITDGENYKLKIIINNINNTKELEITMNLNELIKLSKLCQSIEIIESTKR